MASILGEEVTGSTTDSTTDSTDDHEEDNECCFTLTVSDAHNMDVFDTTGVFCVDPWTLEDDGADFGSSGAGQMKKESNATLEVTMFPETDWQKGLVQEVIPSS